MNASAPLTGISEKLAALLTYICRNKVCDSFTAKLQQMVDNAALSKEWRLEYMTLGMKLQESYEEGLSEGLSLGKSQGRSIMQAELLQKMSEKGMSIEAISKLLDMPYSKVRSSLHKSSKETEL